MLNVKRMIDGVSPDEDPLALHVHLVQGQALQGRHRVVLGMPLGNKGDKCVKFVVQVDHFLLFRGCQRSKWLRIVLKSTPKSVNDCQSAVKAGNKQCEQCRRLAYAIRGFFTASKNFRKILDYEGWYVSVQYFVYSTTTSILFFYFSRKYYQLQNLNS